MKRAVREICFVAAGIAGLSLTGAALADNITLYNTGADAGGLVAPGAANTPWTVSPAGVGDGTSRVISAGNRYSGWIPNSAISQWIGTADVSNTGPVGSYSFDQRFDLTGLVASTATIGGRWAGDDLLIDIRINGVSVGTDGIGGAAVGAGTSWTDWHAFNIAANNAAFTNGINTISLVIQNSDNFLEGVRVELSGTARAIPAPSVFVPLALAGLIAARRRRA